MVKTLPKIRLAPYNTLRMSKHSFFSVIIPTLNEERFLPNLLASLTHQTQKNFEVIVVDGKSRDKTVQVARAFQRRLPKLQVIVAPKARLPLQRNIGAQKARGDWFIFIDADSVILPYFFQQVESFINENKPQVFTTWFRPDSEVPGDALLTILGVMMLEGSILFKRPFITPGPLTVVEREVFEAVGGYNERHTFNEDVDLGFRLYQRGVKLAILRETLYVWSMRRLRTQGMLRVAQQYVRAALPILLFRRPLSYMPDYIMGGHLYGKEKHPVKRSILLVYEKKLKALIRDLFE